MKNISEAAGELIANRIFAENSVDAVLQDSAVRVDKDNIEKYYFDEEAYDGLMPNENDLSKRYILKFIADTIVKKEHTPSEKILKFCEFTGNMANLFPLPFQNNQRVYPKPTDYFWGGTEELLILKGSDWCGEAARVFCALTQIHNIPSRILYAFGNDDGHVINEALIDGRWILIDSTNAVVYRDGNGDFLSVNDYFIDRERFLDAIKKYDTKYYSRPKFFEHIFISNYWISQAEKYNYKLSFCNDYYKGILSKCWNQN
jgi:hypothetical protein